MSRPVLLDLFCGAGGAGMGYHRAGFDVVGVDLVNQPNYPFEFHQDDAVDVLRAIAEGDPFYPSWMKPFDAIHASPPCQKWALASRYNGRDYPDLIGPVRKLLRRQTRPWVIENVPRAPIRPDLKLCGCMFGLELDGIGQLRRERWFETSWHHFGLTPAHDHHGPAISIAGHGTPSWMRTRTGHVGVALWREVMDVDWTTREELTEAIPPAYTAHVGAHLLEHLKVRDAA
jgi:DNA (cytosine-5)-methyltransferase 1